MTDQAYQQMPTKQIAILLTETAHTALTRILLEQDSAPPLDDDQIDARIKRLEQESLGLKRRARRGDFSTSEPTLRVAADALGISLPTDIPVELGRRAIDLFREMQEIEAKALDREDARSAAGSLVARFGTGTVDQFLEARTVRLSDAWTRALKLHPTKSMKGNIDAIARVAIAFFGDVPVSMISKQQEEEFFAWMARLPKKQDRSHGKNRHTERARREGRLIETSLQLTKQDEIDLADAQDEAITEEIRARTDICE